jgi:hypothetical protein
VAAALVGRGVQGVGIAGIHPHLVGAGVVIHVQDALPGVTAVGGLVQAAVAAGAPEWALGRDVDHVGVARIDGDAADVLGFGQADVGPALTAVQALVDAVAKGHRALRVVLARTDPDHIGVVGVHPDGSNGVQTLTVEDRGPGGAGVFCLPHAARGHCHEEAVPLAGRDGEFDDPPGVDGGADVAELQGRQRRCRQFGVVCLVLGSVSKGNNQRQDQNCEQQMSHTALQRRVVTETMIAALPVIMKRAVAATAAGTAGTGAAAGTAAASIGVREVPRFEQGIFLVAAWPPSPTKLRGRTLGQPPALSGPKGPSELAGVVEGGERWWPRVCDGRVRGNPHGKGRWPRPLV